MHTVQKSDRNDKVLSGLIFEKLYCERSQAGGCVRVVSCLRFIFDDLCERLYDEALGHGVDVQCQSDTGV